MNTHELFAAPPAGLWASFSKNTEKRSAANCHFNFEKQVLNMAFINGWEDFPTL